MSKIVLINADIHLDRVDGASIWLSNTINKLFDEKKKVILLSSYVCKTDNVLKNIIDKTNLLFVNPQKDLSGEEIKNEIKKQNNNQIDKIIIRNNKLLDVINKDWEFLSRTTIYALDIHLNNVKKLENKFEKLWVQSEEFKKLYLDNGILEEKIEITEPEAIKYDFDLPERTDDEIRLIYCGTLRDEENILEIIEEFKKIHAERPEVLLTMCYGKIHGDKEFTDKVNSIIKEGVDGITFKYNLSHRDCCYQMAQSDIGICWRKNGWGDNGEVSTKVKEYEMYGLMINYNLSKPVLLVSYIHDKFIYELYEYFKNDFFILLDNFNNHTPSLQNKFIRLASVIFCEFCDENVLWYSKYKLNKTKLVVRVHRYELFNKIFYDINWKNVNKLIFISNKIKKLANKLLLERNNIKEENFDHDYYLAMNKNILLNDGIDITNKKNLWNHWINNGSKRTHKIPLVSLKDSNNNICDEFKHFSGGTVIYNYVNPNLMKQKVIGNEFNIGIVGILPQIKRIDIAVDIIERLVKKDKRFKLFVYGKKYNEWTGTSNNNNEIKYYKNIEKTIQEKGLQNHIIFKGYTTNISEIYKNIGFLLSVSDIEGSHQVVAEAMSTGTIPFIYGNALKNYDLDELYFKKLCFYESDITNLCNTLFYYTNNVEIKNNLSEECINYAYNFNINSTYKKIRPLIINTKDFFKDIKEILNSKKNIYKYESDTKIKISGIFDKFTLTTFYNYFNIIPFDINDSFDVLTEKIKSIKFFFIETSWDFQGLSFAKPKGIIQERQFANSLNLLEKIKKISIINNFKIIVWNKEDPTNFERFSYLIEYADHFFTSDINMIEKYKSTYNKNVYPLGFFIDPYLHNPINNTNLFEISFAGRVYPMHKNRFNESNDILETIKKTNLELILFDRINDPTREDSFLFYPEFKTNVYGKLDYEEVLKIYKYFKIIVNLNTVQNSKTMFARRVYEIIGFKKNIISNFSLGVKEKFESVYIYDNKNNLLNFLNFIYNNIIENEYKKHIEWRNTNLKYSFKKMFNDVLNICELQEYKLNQIESNRILILYYKECNKEISNKFNGINNFELIEINNSDEINNHKKKFEKFDYIVFLSNSNYYSDYYIIDSLLLLEHSPFKIISKPINIIDEYQVVEKKTTQLFSTIIKSDILFNIENNNLSFDNNINILYSDRFNFIQGLNKTTYGIKDYMILYNNQQTLNINVLEYTTMFYNNKEFLLKKGKNEIKLLDIEDKKFYFENNCSIIFNFMS